MAPRWIESLYLKHVGRKEVRRALRKTSAEELKDMARSKEQVTNIIAAITGALTALAGFLPTIQEWMNEAPELIDHTQEGLEKASEGVSSGNITMMVGGAVMVLMGISKFFGRLNRKSEVVDAAITAAETVDSRRKEELRAIVARRTRR